MPYRLKRLTPHNVAEYHWKFDEVPATFTVAGNVFALPTSLVPPQALPSPLNFAATFPGLTQRPIELKPDPHWYKENEIVVKIPKDAADSEFTITTSVRFAMRPGAHCSGPDTQFPVQTVSVVAAPTIEWATEQRATAVCIGDEVVISDVEITGNVDIVVEYSIRYWASFEEGVGSAPAAETQHILLDDTKKSLDFTTGEGGMFEEEGLYVIQVTGISDRYSRKALNQVDFAMTTPMAKYEVYVFPKITDDDSHKLEHIRNNPVTP